MIHESVASSIGQTPLVSLSRLFPFDTLRAKAAEILRTELI
jgi:hypothetical protein